MHARCHFPIQQVDHFAAKDIVNRQKINEPSTINPLFSLLLMIINLIFRVIKYS